MPNPNPDLPCWQDLLNVREKIVAQLPNQRPPNNETLTVRLPWSDWDMCARSLFLVAQIQAPSKE